MKKLCFIILALSALLPQTVSAQNDVAFKHLGWGVSLGTTGVGIEVAAPVTDFMEVRAGYSFLPSISHDFDVDFHSKENWLEKEDHSGYYNHTDVKGTINMGDAKVLLDFYPSKSSGFHFTAGAYLGKSKLVEAKTTSHFINKLYWGNSGPELGNGSNSYTVVSDENGVIKADVKVNSFKPYVGIGFGHAVPKGSVGVSFDIGAQFWGKPGVYTHISDDYTTTRGGEYMRVDRNRITNTSEDTYEDLRDGIKTGEKVFAYPTLTLRITGRIF